MKSCIQHNSAAHSNLENAVGNLYVECIEVYVSVTALALDGKADRCGHGCQLGIQRLVVTACQCGFDVNVQIGKAVESGCESCIGTQTGCFKIT